MSTTFGHFQYTTLFCITLTCISHRTTIHRPMLKFGGVSSTVESGLPSTSSLSNSLMRKSLNSPSDVPPSISFRENIVHLVCSEHCNHTFRSFMWFLWFSFKVKLCHWRWSGHWCLDCALSKSKHITLVSCCLFGYSSYIYIPPYWSGDCSSKPIHKLYTSARGHYCGTYVPAYFGLMLKFLTMNVVK